MPANREASYQGLPTLPLSQSTPTLRRSQRGHRQYEVTERIEAPRMSKKQFEYIAHMLARTRPKADLKAKKPTIVTMDGIAAWERVVAEFITGLASTNTQFNRVRFREAVDAAIRTQEDER